MDPVRSVGVLLEQQTRRSLERDWRSDGAAHEFSPDSAVRRGAGAWLFEKLTESFGFVAGLAALALIVAGLSLANTSSQAVTNRNQGNQHADAAQDH